MNCGNCHKCLESARDEYGFPVLASRMVLCADCGNKRCPHATDHNLDCTNSNDPDQIGSVYSTYNYKTA